MNNPKRFWILLNIVAFVFKVIFFIYVYSGLYFMVEFIKEKKRDRRK